MAKKYSRHLGRDPPAYNRKKLVPKEEEAAEVKRKVLEYKKPLQRQRIGKNQHVFMATRFVAAETVQAVEKAKGEVLQGIGEKLEGFMNGSTEQPEHMDNVQWRNYNLSFARAVQSNTNEAKKRISA